MQIKYGNNQKSYLRNGYNIQPQPLGEVIWWNTRGWRENLPHQPQCLVGWTAPSPSIPNERIQEMKIGHWNIM